MTWQDARNILCIRLDYLGDVLMTTPALRALKNAATPRRITLLTSSGGAAAAQYIAEVDDTIVYAAPWLKHGTGRRPENDLAMIEQLRAGQFDAAVIFTVFSQNPLPTAMLCYLAGIPLRLAHCHENPYQLLTDWVRDPEPEELVRHEVRRQLDLVASVGCTTEDERLHFQIRHNDAEQVRALLTSHGIEQGSQWIVLHPGASAASRRYPAQHWAVAARGLAQRLACPLIFTGAADEADLISGIIDQASHPDLKAVSLAGKLDLGMLAALIAEAPLLISNNTGPAHLAAAVGTSVVDLYALTNPQHTPWQVANRVLYHDVPCRFCYKSVCPRGHHDCLVKVTPEQVIDAAIELITPPNQEPVTKIITYHRKSMASTPITVV